MYHPIVISGLSSSFSHQLCLHRLSTHRRVASFLQHVLPVTTFYRCHRSTAVVPYHTPVPIAGTWSSRASKWLTNARPHCLPLPCSPLGLLCRVCFFNFPCIFIFSVFLFLANFFVLALFSLFDRLFNLSINY